MSMTNMGTFSTVNGVQEYSVDNLLTSATASAINEQILLRDSGTIRASGTVAVIQFTNCQIFLNDVANVGNWFDSGTAPLTYYGDSNNRSDTSLALNFDNCSIIHRTTGTRAIFLSNLTNTKIFRQQTGGGSFRVYTQGGANLDGMLLDNVTWEPVDQFSSASNVILKNTGTGFTNFNVPRMDFLYLTQINVVSSASLGVGNGGNNSIVIINPIAFDDTTISMQSANSKYFKLISSSWNFKDRDNGTNVEGVLLILNSDKSGSMTELGRYTTNADGLLTGTYDSFTETTGSNQVRETLYTWPSYSDTSGSTHGSGAFTYDLIDVDTQIEIRSYLHQPPTGYQVGDSYTLTDPQGILNADYSVNTYQTFTLNNDLNITETNTTTVLAYTDFGTTEKLHDRAKLEWRNNDNYPLISKVGSQLDIGSVDLTIDAAASPDYSATLTTITAKAAVYTGGVTATAGDLTTRNGALLSGGTFNCDINYQSGANTTITEITCTETVDFNTAGTYTQDGGTINEITNSSGGAITLLLENGATVTTNTGPNITLIQNVDVFNSNLIDLTRVQLYNVTKNASLDNSAVSGSGGYSFTVNLLSASVDIGDTLRIKGVQTDGVTAQAEYQESGILTASGLEFIGTQSAQPVYNAWALDGSSFTSKFTANYVSDRVNIIVSGPWKVSEFGAWWMYNLTTATGIEEFFGGVTFIDEANIGINTSVVNIFLDTTMTSGTAFQEDNRRLFRIGDENTRPVLNPTTGGGSVDVEWRGKVFQAPGGGSGDDAETIYNYFTDSNNADAFKADTTSLASQSSIDSLPVDIDTQLTSAHGSGSWAAGAGGGDDAETIYNFFAAGTNPDIFKSDATRLNQNSQNEGLKDVSKLIPYNDDLPDT